MPISSTTKLRLARDLIHDKALSTLVLTAWRDEGRGMLRLTVEVPVEEGELILRELDCAVAAGEVTTAIDPDVVAESKGTAWRAHRPMRSLR